MEENYNGARLLVLLECGDVFKQVILTPRQFKNVSDAVIRDSMDPEEDGMQAVMITLDEENEIDGEIFEGMTDFEERKPSK